MFMISRLAMRENTSVLVLVVALSCSLWGLRHSHELAIFLGGFVAGLGFYVYYPARVVFPIWIVFLLGLGLLYRKRFSAQEAADRRRDHDGGLRARGDADHLRASRRSRRPSTTAQGRRPLHLQGRARGAEDLGLRATASSAGWVKNVKFGLGTFNNKVVDHSWIYPNYGHGFVDPLTGIVLWVGVALVGLG